MGRQQLPHQRFKSFITEYQIPHSEKRLRSKMETLQSIIRDFTEYNWRVQPRKQWRNTFTHLDINTTGATNHCLHVPYQKLKIFFKSFKSYSTRNTQKLTTFQTAERVSFEKWKTNFTLTKSKWMSFGRTTQTTKQH